MSTVGQNATEPKTTGAACAVPTSPIGTGFVTDASQTNATAGAAESSTTSNGASVKDRLKEQAQHASEQAQQYGEHLKEVAQQKFEEMQSKATEYYAQGREKATEATHQVEQYVRTEPTKALIAAAGIGFVLGCLLIRR